VLGKVGNRAESLQGRHAFTHVLKAVRYDISEIAKLEIHSLAFNSANLHDLVLGRAQFIT
jgi:hypothetical protein